jgi:hypothetical protein
MPIDDDLIEPTKRRELFSHYSDEYKQIAFQIWYSNNRPVPSKLLELLPEDEMHRRPDVGWVGKWIALWGEDADRLDIEVKRVTDIDLVGQRADMLKKQANSGRTLQDMGMSYLLEHGFDKAADALRAVVEGVRVERESRGLGEALDRIFKMDDEALRKELVHLLQRDSGAVVDGDILETTDASDFDEPTD